MEVPDGFSIIEPGLFWSRTAPSYAFTFLASLHLKTIIVMDSGTPSRSLTEFASKQNIKLIHLVTESWRSVYDIHQQRLTTKIISEALKHVLNLHNYPIIIVGGNLLTGVIRKLENWSLFSVLNEYNSYSEITGVPSNPFGSVFLEFASFCFGNIETMEHKLMAQNVDSSAFTVTVELPEEEFRPDWVRRFKVGVD